MSVMLTLFAVGFYRRSMAAVWDRLNGDWFLCPEVFQSWSPAGCVVLFERDRCFLVPLLSFIVQACITILEWFFLVTCCSSSSVLPQVCLPSFQFSQKQVTVSWQHITLSVSSPRSGQLMMCASPYSHQSLNHDTLPDMHVSLSVGIPGLQ